MQMHIPPPVFSFFVYVVIWQFKASYARLARFLFTVDSLDNNT